ncbi:hypothetical protein [Dactylosporangium sp. CA-139066]|uniref:hypothetical protein n=1 Tax=Dactylosporangium sp. CA-139066 TaxID=3239930 RepID=UPI003D8B10C3
MRTRAVPDHIFEKLIGAMISEAAGAMLAQRSRSCALHAGEAFGRVLAWLWENTSGPDDVLAYVADLIAQMRYHAPGADASIPLDDVLAGVRRAVAPMAPAEGAAMLACLRAGLPSYL